MVAQRAYLSLVAVVACCVGASSVDDAAALVQNRLEAGRGIAVESNNSSNLSMYMSQEIRYRLVFMENFGASYHCLTEIAFYDKMANPINATFKNQTSCYGCATVCDSCTASYGNPRAQFDGHAGNETEFSVEDSLWSCSAVGSFVDGKGLETVEFELPQRPARYTLKRAHVGDWIAKDWIMQEQRQSGNWVTVSQVANATLMKDQITDVMEAVDAKKFPEDFRGCGGAYSPTAAEIAEFLPDVDGRTLPMQYYPGVHLALINTGRGVQVDGNFGQLTLDDGVYDAIQIHFLFSDFPSQHKLPGENEAKAVGEMHIMHQSKFEVGKPTRLAFLTILLQLPQEGDEPTQEEMFFRGLGLDQIPAWGTPEPLTAVDLTMLGPQLSSVVTTVPCSDTTRWFVSSKYAHVSGYIVQEFRRQASIDYNTLMDSQDDEDNEPMEPGEPLDGGAMMMNLSFVNNTTILADGTVRWTPAVQELTKTQKADAYATGEWRSQFLENEPEEPELVLVTAAPQIYDGPPPAQPEIVAAPPQIQDGPPPAEQR